MKKRKSLKKSAWDKIEEYGIDTSIIRHNLELSPHERVVEHQKILKFYLTLKAAGKKYYARLGKNIKNFD
jgi:hypothetical protein